MNTTIKGITPTRSGVDYHFEMIYDGSADQHFELIFSDTNAEASKKKAPVKVYNETEKWLYDANCTNYERVVEMVERKTPYNKRFTLPKDQIMSYFHAFLVEYLIESNLIKKKLDKGEAVKPSVVYEWYIQFAQRERMKEGQDALQRCSGARTQAEVDKIKAYNNKETDEAYAPTHHIQNLESEGYRVAQIVRKVDAETGHQVGEPDYYVDGEDSEDLEERSSNAFMRTLLLEEVGVAQLDLYYSLWLELRNADYKNKKLWAKARKVSYKVLTSQINLIKDVFRENLAEFGY